jgi:hypothetical protein
VNASGPEYDFSIANPWIADLQLLSARFRGVPDSVLFCIQAIEQNAAVRLEEIHELAKPHGLAVTEQSLAEAHRLLARRARRARR